jgi:hypothetical protein
MIPSKRLTFVAPVLHVSDLRRSIAYYEMQLGFGLEFEYEGFYEHLDACFGVVEAEAGSGRAA